MIQSKLSATFDIVNFGLPITQVTSVPLFANYRKWISCGFFSSLCMGGHILWLSVCFPVNQAPPHMGTTLKVKNLSTFQSYGFDRIYSPSSWSIFLKSGRSDITLFTTIIQNKQNSYIKHSTSISGHTHTRKKTAMNTKADSSLLGYSFNVPFFWWNSFTAKSIYGERD